MSDHEISKAYDPTDVEPRWYRHWNERGYFRADPSSPQPPYSIVLPPPNVTGSLHLGHALTATIQDILIRWKRMSGHQCLWLPGTDHAGIATQMVVERELNKTEGKSRHDLGREAFLERVWEWKEKYGARIGEQHQVLGASPDWSRERFTLDPGLSAAVREVFVRLYEEGLIYRAQRLINWCPSCRTALSDLEVEHEEQDGSLWHIAYPVKGSERRLVVATTRPETMLGDTAVAVHPDDPRYAGLAGQTVLLPLVEREIPIIADAQLVNMEFGTGVVKVTPAHDFNDYETGLRHRLPMVSILDEAARTNDNAGPFAGLDRYEARQRVLDALRERGLLVKEEPHKLSIGKCQRCGTVVEPRLSPQWFVKIEPLAKPAIAAVEQGRTRFIPDSWTQVFFHWMRNIHDWCISRQIWWGHRIPAWYCAACTPDIRDLSRAKPVVGREKPARCEACGGGEFQQDPDVLDTWFSSGLWPFSTLGWPADTPELRKFYPTSVMETGHDIIFFWVARMLMMGLHFMPDVPFRIVYLHAMVRDEKGEKMSKVKGNVIDPLHVVRGAPAKELPPAIRNKFPQGMPPFGADALRFTLAALTQQGRDIKLSLDRVGGYKAFVNKLWNASRFALMNLEGFKPDERPIHQWLLSLADRWILARLSRAIAETQLALDEFRFAEAASGLYQFLWYELCDWYIELSKIALNGDDRDARDAARATLVFCLDHVLRLLHPFMPFITEEIWQRLPIDRDRESIMLAQYPTPKVELRDDDAEREMAPIISAIEGLRTIRGESNLPPQLKLQAEIQSADPALRETLSRWRHYLLPLAGLKEARVVPPGPKPAQAAAHVEPRMEIYVPLAGIIDLEEERRRLEKEIGKAAQELASLNQKLENPNFVTRAPGEVVEAHRARIQELLARKAKMQENLTRIAPEATMSETNIPGGGKRPDDQELEPTLESGTLKVSSGGGEGAVNLGEELKGELEDLKVPPEADPHVRQALEKLREGAQDLPPKDRYDLGVAFMGMGLVDDAVREFTAAQAGTGPGGAAPAKARPKRAPKAAQKTSKRSASKRGAVAHRSAPAKRGAVAKRSPPVKRGAVAKRSPAAKQVAAAKRSPAAKQVAVAKRSAAGKRGAAQQSAGGKRSASANRVLPVKGSTRPKKRGR